MKMKVELEKILKAIASEMTIATVSVETSIEMFMSYIKSNRRMDTYVYYQYLMKSLEGYFGLLQVRETKDIDNLVVQKIIKLAKAEGNKNTTINKKVKALIYMLKYLTKTGLISPVEIDFEPLECDEERFSIISQDSIKIILDNISKYNPKIELIFRLILITGIRRTELCYIKLKHIDHNEGSIFLEHTKNKKSRYIFIDKRCTELILMISGTSKTYLFENTPGIHIRPDYVSYVFKKIKKDLNIDECLSPHVLRHTLATTLLENNVDLESIRLLLGHSDYSMLKRYIHIQNKSLRDICLNKGAIRPTD